MMELLEFIGLLTMAANKNLHPLQSSTPSLTTSSIHTNQVKTVRMDLSWDHFNFQSTSQNTHLTSKVVISAVGRGGGGGGAGHATACSRCDAVTHARLCYHAYCSALTMFSNCATHAHLLYLYISPCRFGTAVCSSTFAHNCSQASAIPNCTLHL